MNYISLSSIFPTIVCSFYIYIYIYIYQQFSRNSPTVECIIKYLWFQITWITFSITFILFSLSSRWQNCRAGWWLLPWKTILLLLGLVCSSGPEVDMRWSATSVSHTCFVWLPVWYISSWLCVWPLYCFSAAFTSLCFWFQTTKGASAFKICRGVEAVGGSLRSVYYCHWTASSKHVIYNI